MAHMSTDDIIEAFKYHPPKDEMIAENHQFVRELLCSTAINIFEVIPECPERTHAINKIREAMFWANAAIAVHS